MGISKIFKDKPKDEDGPLPEVEGKLEKKERKEKEKKEKKEKKNGKGKGEPAPSFVARVNAAPAPEVFDEDRALAGLSPAAKLARQHTLRSKADDEAKRSSQVGPSAGAVAGTAGTGEPTWDKSTVTRPGPGPGSGSAPSVHSNTGAGVLPSLGSVLPSLPVSPTTSSGSHGTATEVVHVQPRSVSSGTVHHVHAVNVSDAEYDSEDDEDSDASVSDVDGEGETMEDVTFQMGRSKLSDEADLEFRSIWGSTYIDKRLVPKKGILKSESGVLSCGIAASFPTCLYPLTLFLSGRSGKLLYPISSSSLLPPSLWIHSSPLHPS